MMHEMNLWKPTTEWLNYLKIIHRRERDETWTAFEDFLMLQFSLMWLDLTHCAEHLVAWPALYQFFHMSLTMSIQNCSWLELFVTNFANWNFAGSFLMLKKGNISFKNIFQMIDVFTSWVFICIFSIPGPLKLRKQISHCGCFLQFAFKINYT